ncbi:hypothetical protein ScalyP_jg9019 [Parmales sp. scaly parma]|nr:hypothetical protein ScalyP_jg9019 [Parmales sp. scaly parma]
MGFFAKKKKNHDKNNLQEPPDLPPTPPPALQIIDEKLMKMHASCLKSIQSSQDSLTTLFLQKQPDLLTLPTANPTLLQAMTKTSSEASCIHALTLIPLTSGPELLINELSKLQKPDPTQAPSNNTSIGQSPLHNASKRNIGKFFKQIMSIILEGGTSPHPIHATTLLNQPNFCGETPLYCACAVGAPSVVNVLCEEEIKIQLNVIPSHPDGATPLHVAAAFAGPDTLAPLLNTKIYKLNKNNEVNLPDKDGVTALLLAVKCENLRAVTVLVAAGGDLHDPAPEALYVASQNGSVATVTFLVEECGADVFRFDCGAQAWHVGVMMGNIGVVDYLVERMKKEQEKKQEGQRKFDVDFKIPGSGVTAIHLACQSGSSEMVAKVLSFNASVNLQGETGVTGLMIAARSGKREIMQLLIAHGSKLDVEDKFGKVALDYAKEAVSQGGIVNSKQCVKILEEEEGACAAKKPKKKKKKKKKKGEGEGEGEKRPSPADKRFEEGKTEEAKTKCITTKKSNLPTME